MPEMYEYGPGYDGNEPPPQQSTPTERLLQERQTLIEVYEEALRSIVGPTDSGPYIEIYREAGGGYEGLQAMAEYALTAGHGIKNGWGPLTAHAKARRAVTKEAI